MTIRCIKSNQVIKNILGDGGFSICDSCWKMWEKIRVNCKCYMPSRESLENCINSDNLTSRCHPINCKEFVFLEGNF